MTLVTIYIFVLLLMLVGCIFLQIFLSKKESKWPGLILPAICFCYGLLMVLGLAGFAGMSGKDMFVTVLTSFITGNIPTLILLAIYAACRGKQRKKAALEKMQAQDLE